MDRFLTLALYALAIGTVIVDVATRLAGGAPDLHSLVLAGFALVLIKLDEIKKLMPNHPSQQSAGLRWAKQNQAERIKQGLRTAAAGRASADGEAGRS